MSAPFSIKVSEHAYWRAAERFRGFDTVTIEDEIVAAFREGRVSPDCPRGIEYCVSDPNCLYAWTSDERRVYVLRCDIKDERVFAVLTVMDPRNG